LAVFSGALLIMRIMLSVVSREAVFLSFRVSVTRAKAVCLLVDRRLW